MYATRIDDLREAAEQIERKIQFYKDDWARQGAFPDVSPYEIQDREGNFVLAPLLAQQITILNQIRELEANPPVIPTPEVDQCMHWMITAPCGLGANQPIHHDRTNPDYHEFLKFER